MPTIFDSIEQQVASTAVQQIVARLGVDPGVAQQVVNGAIPVITAAIASHVRSGGAQAIHREATSQTTNPTQNGSLPQILGDEGQAMEQRVSDATGVSRENAAKVINAVAPAVMRGIGQHVQQNGIDASQLSSVLGTLGPGARSSPTSTGSDEARM